MIIAVSIRPKGAPSRDAPPGWPADACCVSVIDENYRRVPAGAREDADDIGSGGTHAGRVSLMKRAGAPPRYPKMIELLPVAARPFRGTTTGQKTGMMSSGSMSSATSTPSMSSSGMAGNAMPHRVTIARTRAMATRQFSACSS